MAQSELIGVFKVVKIENGFLVECSPDDEIPPRIKYVGEILEVGNAVVSTLIERKLDHANRTER